MFVAIGIVILLVMVFGGFVIAGGSLGPVLAALPLEMMIIGGAGAGAPVTGKSRRGLRDIGGAPSRPLAEPPRY
ncbi:MAG TPA: flagellar motor stator protein MotA, partial [Novosphingobium sp.]|nr:flagellar motor stator protein MotA [Novosphingobium sp.]